MYSDKINVNILTSLMLSHGIKNVVVCPGSRNAPLAHNFATCKEINCISVTDERSAGFYAIGLALASECPVAICVTSGSALLNVMPAIAEAYYRQLPVLVISADRPTAMIGQMQGQTMPQVGMMNGIVRCEVQLPEPHCDIERWHCNRLINEALAMLTLHGGGPVHINVPISEPLYTFDTHCLPSERKITISQAKADVGILKEVASEFANSPRPMLVIGQLERRQWRIMADAIASLQDKVVIVAEMLSADADMPYPPLDMYMGKMRTPELYRPDFVIYIGGNMVSKSMRQFLQESKPKRSVVVTPTGGVTDVLMNATDIIEAQPEEIVNEICCQSDFSASRLWSLLWQVLRSDVSSAIRNYEGEYSQVEAVKSFFMAVKDKPFDIHVANSMSVRVALLFADRYLHVNRGINGIEGSLSVAAGYSLMSHIPVACIIGDLSFFYDANALWHKGLCGNLRVLLINNGGGGIFGKFKSLADSPARDEYVMARHSTSAEGICLQNNMAYRRVTDTAELHDAMAWLVNEHSPVPMLLEVMTDAEIDQKEYERILNS